MMHGGGGSRSMAEHNPSSHMIFITFGLNRSYPSLYSGASFLKQSWMSGPGSILPSKNGCRDHPRLLRAWTGDGKPREAALRIFHTQYVSSTWLTSLYIHPPDQRV